jgi:hypothetical protein
MIYCPQRERAQRAAACVGVDAGKFTFQETIRAEFENTSGSDLAPAHSLDTLRARLMVVFGASRDML